MSITTVKAQALENGIFWPGVSTEDRKAFADIRDGVRKIPEYARRIDEAAVRLNGMSAKSADPRWQRARNAINQARTDLIRFNQATRTAFTAAVASGDLKETDAGTIVANPVSLSLSGGLGAAVIWLQIVGFAAAVVAAIMVPAWAPVILGVAALLVLAEPIIESISKAVVAVGNAVANAPTAAGIGMIGVLGLIGFGLYVWSKKGKVTS